MNYSLSARRKVNALWQTVNVAYDHAYFSGDNAYLKCTAWVDAIKGLDAASWESGNEVVSSFIEQAASAGSNQCTKADLILILACTDSNTAKRVLMEMNDVALTNLQTAYTAKLLQIAGANVTYNKCTIVTAIVDTHD